MASIALNRSSIYPLSLVLLFCSWALMAQSMTAPSANVNPSTDPCIPQLISSLSKQFQELKSKLKGPSPTYPSPISWPSMTPFNPSPSTPGKSSSFPSAPCPSSQQSQSGFPQSQSQVADMVKSITAAQTQSSGSGAPSTADTSRPLPHCLAKKDVGATPSSGMTPSGQPQTPIPGQGSTNVQPAGPIPTTPCSSFLGAQQQQPSTQMTSQPGPAGSCVPKSHQLQNKGTQGSPSSGPGQSTDQSSQASPLAAALANDCGCSLSSTSDINSVMNSVVSIIDKDGQAKTVPVSSIVPKPTGPSCSSSPGGSAAQGQTVI